jgi:Protein of unknown function (DUF4235)
VHRQTQRTDLAVAIPERQAGTPVVARLMFAPVKLVAKRLAPRLSTRLFESLWRVIDGEAPPPRAEERQHSVAKLTVALALEGACTAIVSGLLDHASRREFARLTGRWPARRAKS